MKFSYYNLAGIILFATALFLKKEDEPETNTIVPTGIMLDTLNNEVILQLEDGLPKYFYSNIFTPVCNTGECLPVKINIYWDLTGKYLRFDLAEGEILTKLDHVPFSKEDYDLLHEILADENDPRRIYLAKQFKGSPIEDNTNQGEDQSMPAPQAFVFATKYEMVDGITGSTLPHSEGKFVPGALYTTYTLWGLVHDFQAYMQNYTNFSLLRPEYYDFFLSSDYYQAREEVIALIMGNNSAPNYHATVCCSLLDTCDLTIQKNVMNHFRYNEYALPNVQKQFLKTFSSSSDLNLKHLIIGKWQYNDITDKTYTELSGLIAENQASMNDLINLFRMKFYPTEANFNAWIAELDELEPANRKLMVDLLKEKKDLLSKKQKKVLKKL
ncbi:MAG: hypothetical protein R2780_01105 [Crocinitomicaceae bacterium]